MDTFCNSTEHVDSVLVIDFVCDASINGKQMLEVSYKHCKFDSPTRIVSFTYKNCGNNMNADDIVHNNYLAYKPIRNGYNYKYSIDWFVSFFSNYKVIFTRGVENKNFIMRLIHKNLKHKIAVFDLLTDNLNYVKIGMANIRLLYKYQIHTLPFQITDEYIKNWKDSSMCPYSRCRNNHDSYTCSFNNMKCMLNWLNGTIF